MNISLVNTSVVMLTFYCQDLGKAALAHISEVKPCRRLPRRERVLLFPVSCSTEACFKRELQESTSDMQVTRPTGRGIR